LVLKSPIGYRPIIISQGIFRVDLDGFAVILNRLPVVAKVPIGIPQVIIGSVVTIVNFSGMFKREFFDKNLEMLTLEPKPPQRPAEQKAPAGAKKTRR
jgi:hypothetical protein